MDIAALSASMANASLALKVGTSVLSLSKNVMEQQGQSLAVLLQAASSSTVRMEQSVTPFRGGNIDIKL
ncbi:MAG: putative motility protein [Firmicutes bacterium HGW-Firmicutes-7]|nr:MAG: putative motility protein [Firmicutes bacterium HGW-Firmicutes-7]